VPKVLEERLGPEEQPVLAVLQGLRELRELVV
jgi:hypothetical protein